LRSRVLLATAFVLSLVAPAAACGWDWTVEPKASPDGGDAGDASSDKDVSDGTCSPKAPCPKDSVCAYDDELCGQGVDSPTGVCVPREIDCTGVEQHLTCACDGFVYKSVCAASLAGFDVARTKLCEAPDAGDFGCGVEFCQQNEFCLNDKVCTTWACDERSCACATAQAQCSGATCATEDGGATFVTCGGK
jgi:hypothetical protein